MSSNTENFFQIRKSTFMEESYTRGTQSSTKRLPYNPRKLSIKPLNLNGIKKELEETFKETQEYSTNRPTLNDVVIKEVKTSNILEFPHKLGKICEVNHFSDISNVETVDRSNSRQIISGEIVLINGKENICDKRNDSFDLDFSVLSTPLKNENHGTGSKKMPNNVHKCNESQINLLRDRSSYKNLPQKMVMKSSLKGNNINVHDQFQKVSRFTQTDALLVKCSPELNQNPHVQKKISPIMSSAKLLQCDKFERIRVNNVEYIKLNLLGKGGSSEVFHCYDEKSKTHVAIKFISLQNSHSASGYINEVKLLQQLQNCSKIIKLYDYEIPDAGEKLLVVLEKGDGDLSVLLKQLAIQKSNIPMYMLLFYWLEMLHAVKQIHFHGIIHSDLKPANFIKAGGGLKLIDFGIASSVQTDMTSVIKSSQEGSCNYISPEALNNESEGNCENQNYVSCKYKLHFKSDVWSLGCILYQLVYKRTPFQHILNLWAKLATIMDPKHKIEYPEANWISSKIINTIKKCLQYNVKSRPSVDELIDEYEKILHNM